MIGRFAIVLMAALVACTDSREDIVSSGGDRFISVWNIGPDGKGKARSVRVSDLDAQTRARVEAIGFDPEHWPERMKRWLASVQKGSPAFAITTGNLPEGAVALVIRDPSAAVDRVIAVSEASVDDEVLALAQHTLLQDEIGTPRASSRRVLTVFADRRVRIETDAGTVWHSFRLEFLTQERRKRTDRLIARAAGAPELEMQGIGQARVVAAVPHPLKRRGH